jgi:hypothetical protein
LAGKEIRLQFILHSQLEKGHNDELVKDVTSNECPADLGRGNWLEKGRNNEPAKDATDGRLISKGGSLAVGEFRLRLILHSSAGEGLQGRAEGGRWGNVIGCSFGRSLLPTHTTFQLVKDATISC